MKQIMTYQLATSFKICKFIVLQVLLDKILLLMCKSNQTKSNAVTYSRSLISFSAIFCQFGTHFELIVSRVNDLVQTSISTDLGQESIFSESTKIYLEAFYF